MSELKQFFKPLSVEDNIILKLPEAANNSISNIIVFEGNQSVYISTKKIVDKNHL